jgi:hypothetical protein
MLLLYSPTSCIVASLLYNSSMCESTRSTRHDISVLSYLHVFLAVTTSVLGEAITHSTIDRC